MEAPRCSTVCTAYHQGCCATSKGSQDVLLSTTHTSEGTIGPKFPPQEPQDAWQSIPDTTANEHEKILNELQEFLLNPAS